MPVRTVTLSGTLTNTGNIRSDYTVTLLTKQLFYEGGDSGVMSASQTASGIASGGTAAIRITYTWPLTGPGDQIHAWYTVAITSPEARTLIDTASTPRGYTELYTTGATFTSTTTIARKIVPGYVDANFQLGVIEGGGLPTWLPLVAIGGFLLWIFGRRRRRRV